MADNRSQSRGRDLFSTGRGGVGNIRRSDSTEPSNYVVPELNRTVSGREASIDSPDRVTHFGRGGAGNVRSPSRDVRVVEPTVTEEDYERRVIAKAQAERSAVSTGRGGAGNIDTSRSRSRGPLSDAGSVDSRSLSRGRIPHSSGRGGAGNITFAGGDVAELEMVEELERLEHAHPPGIHSTGRGGIANMTKKTAPGPEHPDHKHEEGIFSTGRGGAGNIRTSRSQSRDPNSPGFINKVAKGLHLHA